MRGATRHRPLLATVLTTVLLSAAIFSAPLARGAGSPDPALELASPFVDGAVLQREMPVPVWGQARPGSTVTVSFAGQTRTATADAKGVWRVDLGPLEASGEGRSLLVATPDGESLTVGDLLVGEVWFASGQSNMEWVAGKSMCRDLAASLQRSKTEVPVREYAVDIGSALFPRRRTTSADGWKRSRQASSFSALALAFAEALHRELGVPVGILRSSHGATQIETWTPYEGFAARPALEDIARKVRRSDPATAEGRAAYEAFCEDLRRWREASAQITRRGGAALPRPALPGIAAEWRGPTRMYNKKIAPLIPYAIRGAIWCQGTANASDGRVYADKMAALVDGWRECWGRPDLPFYFTQMQCYGEPDPSSVGFADIREAQRRFFMSAANVGMVLQHDLNPQRPAGIHYSNKLDPGRRLARWALAKEYGRDIAYTGPIYASHTVEGSRVRVRFEQRGPGGPLMVGSKGVEGSPDYTEPARETPGEPLRHFRLAGRDGVWHEAEATIAGDHEVVVTSSAVPEPVGVQYAYSASPIGANLYCRAGLPATPFASFDGKPLFQEDLRSDAEATGDAAEPPPAPKPYLHVSSIYRHHAVIQRGRPVPVWGHALPGAKIEVTFAGQTKRAVAGEFERWEVRLDPLEATAEGRDLTVSCEGGPTVTVQDVVVGDVWVLTGTRALTDRLVLSRDTSPDDLPGAMPLVREFRIKTKARRFRTPRERRFEIGGADKYRAFWRPVTLAEPHVDTSVAAYWFGSRVQRGDVPLGIVTLGADNPPLTWMSRDSLQTAAGFETERDEVNLLYPDTDSCRRAVDGYIETIRRYVRDVARLRRAGEELPDELAESAPAFPEPFWDQWASRTETACQTYNFCVSPLTPSAIRGVAWVPGPDNVGSDASRYGAALAAYARSLPQTYGQEEVLFVHARPTAELVPGIARPEIEGARSTDLDAWPKSLRDVATRLGDLAAEASRIPLGGTWRFQLDPEDVGVEERWYAQELEDTVTLPGTTDTNRKGTFKDERAIDRLSRVWYWRGPAWYQRDVTIPEAWRGRRITLLLERTKTTRVWVDERDAGGDDTLSAPQVFDLTGVLSPGPHTLTVLVDNAKLPPVGPSHAVDERTQTNWNGIVGRIELRATDPVWLEEVQVLPDVEGRRALVRAVIGNTTGEPATGRILLSARSRNVAEPRAFSPVAREVSVPAEGAEVTVPCALGEDAPLWDEFHPALIRLSVSLRTRAGGRWLHDERSVDFGLREIARDGSRLRINGRPLFLRGRIDSAFFPLTGHPPMEKAEWIRMLRIVKSYGLNHCRFHSWFPPEAALEAADEVGLYLAPELPNKRSAFGSLEERSEGERYNVDYLEVESTASHTPLARYLLREGTLIFRAYGNHPSFVMFTLGNELGRRPAMQQMVSYFREIDPRRLYAQGSNNMHWAPSFAEGDDFWVTGKTAKTLPVRGSFFSPDFPDGHVENRPPSTLVDFRASIAGVPAPVIGHETGQYQVAPDFRDIPKYTGVLKARNIETFRERLEEAGMLDLADDFVRASGALSAICYREDIEAALRTPGLGGFQLLDLVDFLGQGTALVGMLNVFLEPKGIIEPAAWREFCCETVPLLRMEKYTWTTDETFRAGIQVAHHGAGAIEDARVTWSVRREEREASGGTTPDGAGLELASGALGPLTIEPGEVAAIGRVSFPLRDVPAPAKLTVTVAIEKTGYRNRYPVWVYPPEVDTSAPEGVLVASRLDAAARRHLDAGGRLLLFPEHEELEHCVKGAFQTDFWCWPMFARGARRRGIEPAPGTLGFLCDPEHPALAEFPTELHSNWQWWRIVKRSRPIILDETPRAYRPTIHVIDNFARNHKLGLLFETRVGPGRLLVCASDLPGLQDHPEARQLMRSLLRYVGSEAFAPTAELDAALLGKLLPGDAPGRS